MSKLTSMAFTLSADREITPEHYIMPGSYVLNGVLFDFCETSGTIADGGRSISFYVSDFDEMYSDRDILTEDTGKGFAEFYVYTGEYDDPDVKITGIEALQFGFDDGSFTAASEAVLMSANRALAEADPVQSSFYLPCGLQLSAAQ